MDAMPLPHAWGRFKVELPHQKPPMAARNWGSPLHSLCSYQGKLKPSIARVLVETFVPHGGRVLDPFAGAGTIPFEACLTGRIGLGIEISPSAFAICDAKLHEHDPNVVELALDELESHIAGWHVAKEDLDVEGEFGLNGRLRDYFHPQTFSEILSARAFFQQRPAATPESRLVHACLQHILHGNRPYALSRNSHPITPYAPSGCFEYRGVMARLRTKVARSLAVDLGPGFRAGATYMGDCTEEWPREVSDLDAIITSPPFFDSTRFYSANWMRLWFSGWSKEDFKTLPARFVDERQKVTFRVYESIFRQADQRLSSSGVIVMHLGKSRKCDMGAEIEKVARDRFRLLDRFSENVAHCESHGIRDKGTVTSHEYLVFGR